MAFSQIIYEVTTPQAITGRPIITVSDAAKIMSVSESTIYDYRQDRTEPSYSKLKALAHELNRRGYHKLSLQFFDNTEGTANGDTRDETIEIIRQLGLVSEAQDGSVIINAAAEIERQARNLRAEGEQR